MFEILPFLFVKRYEIPFLKMYEWMSWD